MLSLIGVALCCRLDWHSAVSMEQYEPAAQSHPVMEQMHRQPPSCLEQHVTADHFRNWQQCTEWDVAPRLRQHDSAASPEPAVKQPHWYSSTRLEQTWMAQKVVMMDNQLTRRLPESWSNMTNLSQLWLSYNNLTGALPQTWDNISSNISAT